MTDDMPYSTAYRDDEARRPDEVDAFLDRDEPAPEQRPEDDAAGPDPEDDPAFREAARGHRALSGHSRNHGRRRGNHGGGRAGQGVRGLRSADKAPQRPIRATGRNLGSAPPAVGRPSLDDVGGLLERLLGSERVELLRASFRKRGAPTRDQRRARAYLAQVLILLDATNANRGAARLLLDYPDGDTPADVATRAAAMRKLKDARRAFRRSSPEARAATLGLVREDLSR